ncbi:hypothetical protein Bca52824_061053, partial [Brassica carinata]
MNAKRLSQCVKIMFSFTTHIRWHCLEAQLTLTIPLLKSPKVMSPDATTRVLPLVLSCKSSIASTVFLTAPLKRTSSWSFDEKLLIQSLYKVLTYVSKANPIVLYLRDIENLLFRSQRTYNLFQKLLQKLSGPVLILGSRIMDLSSEDAHEIDEKLSAVFPYNIDIRPPDDETHL